MKNLVNIIFLLTIFFLSSCEDKKTIIESFEALDSIPKTIVIQNNYPVNK